MRHRHAEYALMGGIVFPKTLFAALLFQALAPCEGLAGELTFEDAWSRAKSTAISLKRAANDQVSAAQQKALAEYEDDARLSAQASLAQRYKKSDPDARLKVDEVTREQAYGLTLAVPLYDFGRLEARLAQLSYEAEGFQHAEAEALSALHFQVARAFLAASAARRREEITSAQVGLAEAKLKEQNRLYRQGLRTESDVLAAKVELGRVNITRDTMKSEAFASLLKLATLVGAHFGRDGVDFILPPLSLEVSPAERYVDSLRAREEKSPSVRRREKQLLALGAELARLESEKRPTLSASIGAQEIGSIAPVRPQAAAQLTLGWDIPWSGKGRDEASLYAAKRRALELSGEQESLQRTGQWWAAQHALQAVAQSFAAFAEQAGLVERQLALVTQRYRSGKATALELSAVGGAVLTLKLDQARIVEQAYQAAIDAAEAKGTADLAPLFNSGKSDKGEKG